jgi:hypothetical protein
MSFNKHHSFEDLKSKKFAFCNFRESKINNNGYKSFESQFEELTFS